MPSKSKNKYRRTMRRKHVSTPIDILTDIDSETNAFSDNNEAFKETKPEPVTKDQKYIFSEIKWIGVVTGIVLIFLVIFYILFH